MTRKTALLLRKPILDVSKFFERFIKKSSEEVKNAFQKNETNFFSPKTWTINITEFLNRITRWQIKDINKIWSLEELFFHLQRECFLLSEFFFRVCPLVVVLHKQNLFSVFFSIIFTHRTHAQINNFQPTKNCWLILTSSQWLLLLVTRRWRALLALEFWLAECEGDVSITNHVLKRRYLKLDT